ncbi:uncharacterized protein EKO05_0010322 [Ascochyta rabiei]|uniref:Uncharacterized protein n=1 Tax=Didymella rabiei TaxID=5454 RepID=A0A162WHA9_DIDRA|nr:uncharacterized protein EKO05_0010322 [Ascochyta rabiei]KZM19028.1 hypothetical protein ST47_g9873 [Ascochyta rabiei]UPX20077.1 hypothetical protein EKO05_0010322 [Ascochyta rabiei]
MTPDDVTLRPRKRTIATTDYPDSKDTKAKKLKTGVSSQVSIRESSVSDSSRTSETALSSAASSRTVGRTLSPQSVSTISSRTLEEFPASTGPKLYGNESTQTPERSTSPSATLSAVSTPLHEDDGIVTDNDESDDEEDDFTNSYREGSR